MLGDFQLPGFPGSSWAIARKSSAAGAGPRNVRGWSLWARKKPGRPGAGGWEAPCVAPGRPGPSATGRGAERRLPTTRAASGTALAPPGREFPGAPSAAAPQGLGQTAVPADTGGAPREVVDGPARAVADTFGYRLVRVAGAVGKSCVSAHRIALGWRPRPAPPHSVLTAGWRYPCPSKGPS
jgi:hypothetical protein